LKFLWYFRAVAEAYEQWYTVSDGEVLDLLREQVYEEKAERS